MPIRWRQATRRAMLASTPKLIAKTHRGPTMPLNWTVVAFFVVKGPFH